jgi:hypothetical protein
MNYVIITHLSSASRLTVGGGLLWLSACARLSIDTMYAASLPVTLPLAKGDGRDVWMWMCYDKLVCCVQTYILCHRKCVYATPPPPADNRCLDKDQRLAELGLSWVARLACLRGTKRNSLHAHSRNGALPTLDNIPSRHNPLLSLMAAPVTSGSPILQAAPRSRESILSALTNQSSSCKHSPTTAWSAICG